MSEFVEILKKDPLEIFSNEPTVPLKLTKDVFDSLIKLQKDDPNVKNSIDNITVDGLDANQVWWQVKLVLNEIEGDLVDRIQDLKQLISVEEDDEEEEEEEDAEQLSDNSEEVEDDELSGANETEKFSEDEEQEEEDEKNISNDDDEEEVEEPHLDNLEEDITEEVSNKVNSEDEEDVVEQKEDKYGINDDFFDLEEFNKQTLEADEHDPLDNIDDDNDDEEIDYFGDIPSEDDEEAIYYDDFFDKPNATNKSKSNKKSMNGSDDEMSDEEEYFNNMNSAKLDLFEEEESEDDENSSEVDGEKLSSYQKKQLELQEQIEQLEKEAVAEKKWALKGEVDIKARPEDALLTEDIEFDRTAKPVPIITNEVTESLEDLIRRRIKNYEFDDLQRRTFNDITNKPYKPKFEISDAKSNKSLAEIYEADVEGQKDEEELSEELKAAHNEVTTMFNDLCYKLDALSSAHFIPKPKQQSLEVRVQTSTISMEDAQPLTMSNTSTFAPQEIYKIGKSDNQNEIRLKDGTTMSKDELTREDKGRLRRAMKRKRSKAYAARQEKPNKKSKAESVMDTLGKAKNLTIINDKGERRDIKGDIKKTNTNISSNNIKL